MAATAAITTRNPTPPPPPRARARVLCALVQGLLGYTVLRHGGHVAHVMLCAPLRACAPCVWRVQTEDSVEIMGEEVEDEEHPDEDEDDDDDDDEKE